MKGKAEGRLTEYGFVWGAAEVTRLMSDKRGVVMEISTPRQTVQVFVTPSGLIRVQPIRPPRMNQEEGATA